MKQKAKPKRLYLIPVVTKTLDVLELLQIENQPMLLDTVHKKTKASKTTVYRILKTLVHRGYVTQTSDRHYRYAAQPRKLRFGFGSQSADMPFSQAVTASLREAATAVGVDLLVLDNQYSGKAAIENAETFIREHVDVVIEFQIDERAAPIIAHKIEMARIPFIAVEIPHPYSTFFGINNYQAGLDAGELLADYSISKWGGKMDWMIGLDIEEAGQLVQSRITGAFEGVKARLPHLPAESFMRMDGRGLFQNSYKLILDFLKKHPNERHIFIAAANDPSTLGAIAAARELGREKHVAVVGQDCLEEMLVELQRPGTPAVGSVSHEVKQYGHRLMELGLALQRGQTVAPYNYIEHRVVTADRARQMLATHPVYVSSAKKAKGVVGKAKGKKASAV